MATEVSRHFNRIFHNAAKTRFKKMPGPDVGFPKKNPPLDLGALIRKNVRTNLTELVLSGRD